MNKDIFTSLAKVYLYNEVDNWEWSYSRLVDLMVDEFNFYDVGHGLDDLSDQEADERFRQQVIDQIERFTTLDTIATDELNNRIQVILAEETKDINFK